jgi:hypothetical protein
MFVHPYFSAVQVRTVLARPRNYFRLTEIFSHGNMRLVLAFLKIFFSLTEISVHGNIRLVLTRPRSSFGLAESFLLNDYFYNNAHRGLRCYFLRINRDIFAWQHMDCLGPPKELIKIKCRTPSSPPLGQPRYLCMALKTYLGPSKELIAPREGSHHQSLRANCDVFISKHVYSHSPPKDTTEATSKIHLSLAIDLQSPSHTSSITSFTGSRPVSVQVYWRRLAPIVPVTLWLLVFD